MQSATGVRAHQAESISSQHQAADHTGDVLAQAIAGRLTLAEKPCDMVGRPRSSCASVWSLLLEGCCAKKSLREPLGKPGSAPKLCSEHASAPQ